MLTISIRQATPEDVIVIDDLLAADGRRRERTDIARYISEYVVMINGVEVAAVVADGIVVVHPGYPEHLTCDSLLCLLAAAEARSNSAKAWKHICKESVNSYDAPVKDGLY